MKAGDPVPDGYRWDDFAACNGADPADWFPAPGDHEARARAYAVCQRCPVRTQCLDEAIRLRYPGVWAATSEAERLRMVRA